VSGQEDVLRATTGCIGARTCEDAATGVPLQDDTRACIQHDVAIVIAARVVGVDATTDA
jgi:hypothetical protein